MSVRAPYVADDLTRQVARADSGVQVVLRRTEEDRQTLVWARRFTLEHRESRITLDGGVRIEAQDSLQAEADSLVWEGNEERLELPGALRISTPSGWERGRGLRTDAEFAEWSMEEVSGRWWGSGEEGEYEVRVQARREQGRRAAGHAAVYDSVEVEYDGAVVRSPRALFSEAEGTMRFVDGVSGTDSARSFSADEVTFALRREQVLARGDVSFSEWEGDTEFALLADEVEEDRRTGRLVARGGPACFSQDARRIEAGRLEYARHTGLLEAGGGISFREGDRHLEAAQLVYDRRAEQLQASGDVVLEVPEFSGTIRCGTLVFDLAGETGRFEDEPLLRRPEGDEGLALGAGVMRFDLERRALEGSGPFVASGDDLELRAESGIYLADEELLVLSGGPTLEEEREDGWRSRIQADSMAVELEDGQVARIALSGAVAGTIESSELRTSWIQGRDGQLFFAAGRLERFELGGRADVTYRDRERNEVSRFQGDEMSLFFEAGELQRARVAGKAELLSRLPEKEEEGEEPRISVNQVEGEELLISFADGKIAEVEIGPGVEGRYLPGEDQ